MPEWPSGQYDVIWSDVLYHWSRLHISIVIYRRGFECDVAQCPKAESPSRNVVRLTSPFRIGCCRGLIPRSSRTWFDLSQYSIRKYDTGWSGTVSENAQYSALEQVGATFRLPHTFLTLTQSLVVNPEQPSQHR